MGALKLDHVQTQKTQPKSIKALALKTIGWVVGGYVAICAVALIGGVIHGAFIAEPVKYTVNQ